MAVENLTEVESKLQMIKNTQENSKFLAIQGPFFERADSPSKRITVLWHAVILGTHNDFEFSRKYLCVEHLI